MIRLQIPRILLLVLALIAFAISINAAVPQTMNYQGRLTDDQGQPVNSTVSMTFTIYDAENDGESKWTETHPTVSVIDGLFNVILGQGDPAVPIEDTVFSNSDRWLEVVVEGEVISPRTKLSSSAYALQAGWTLEGGVLYTSGIYGIARNGNTLHGQHDSTHVNLGINSQTGRDGYDYYYSTVGGGQHNYSWNSWSTVCGGGENNASGQYSAIVGGWRNDSRGPYSFIGGGRSNENRNVGETSGSCATVGGGESNQNYESWSTIAGGYYNDTYGVAATVAGGYFNDAIGDSSFVGGGSWNIAGGIASAICGGSRDTAGGDFAMIPGGYGCKASGRYSFAAGRNAKALHDGSFVWADTTDEDFASTAPNQFLIRASGGVGISDELHFGDNSRDFFIKEVKANDPAPWSDLITYDGIGIGSFDGGNQQVLLLADGSGGQNVMVFATTTDGGTTWVPRLSIDHDGDVGIGTEWAGEELTVEGDICYTNSIYQCSDSRYKRNIETINTALEKVTQLRGVTYNWRQDEFPNKKFDNREHLGFIAQEIKDLLPSVVTTNDKGYMSVDYSRVTPLLVEAVKELKSENEKLRAQMVELTSLVETMLAQQNSKNSGSR